MKSPEKFLNCQNCWYYEKGFCHRRERIARWDPVAFVCGDYGVRDDECVSGQLTLGDYGMRI